MILIMDFAKLMFEIQRFYFNCNKIAIKLQIIRYFQELIRIDASLSEHPTCFRAIAYSEAG